MTTSTVRAARPSDAAEIARIYEHYVRETIVTFEEEPVPAEEMARRMEGVERAALPWLVAETSTGLAGYAYATRWRERRGYRFSAEVTVYLDHAHAGRGTGSALYGALLDDLRGRGVHAVLGGIALPNDASVALHEKFGFRKVAHFEETGFKFDRWIDVGYWECILSPTLPSAPRR